MCEIKTSDRLQALVKRLNSLQRLDELVEAAAAVTLHLDELDAYDAVGNTVYGIEIGLRLVQQLEETRRIPNNESAELFKMIFDDYSDGDGRIFLVGVEDHLCSMIELLLAESEESDALAEDEE